MDGFSYLNIYATKGIEYLIVIAFLLLFFPVWKWLNRKEDSNRVAHPKSMPGTGKKL